MVYIIYYLSINNFKYIFFSFHFYDPMRIFIFVFIFYILHLYFILYILYVIFYILYFIFYILYFIFYILYLYFIFYISSFIFHILYIYIHICTHNFYYIFFFTLIWQFSNVKYPVPPLIYFCNVLSKPVAKNFILQIILFIEPLENCQISVKKKI